MIKPLPFFLFFLFFLAVGLAQASDYEMLPDAILYPERKAGHMLVVDKAEQLLYLYRHDQNGQISLEKIMQCSTGENRGDKILEGDKKTPNGFYIFNQKLLPRDLPSIYGALAFPTDYPNFWDIQLGRGGYGIWIHGINKPLTDYDSNGCVELENADIARLEDLIRLYDTPLIIYESLALSPVDELRREADLVLNFLELWRQAWAGKDHQAYRDLYDPGFVNSDGRSLSGWLARKEDVAKDYRKIQVEIRDLRIFRHRDVVVAMFTQDYRADDRFTSVGLKRLYLKKTGAGYKIVGETFRNSPQTETRKWLTAEEKRKALETPPLTLAPAMAAAPGPNEPEISRVSVEARTIAQALTEEKFEIPADEVWAAHEARVMEEAEAQARAIDEANAIAEARAEAEARAIAEARAEDEARARAEAEVLARLEAEAAARARAEARATELSEAQEGVNRELIELVRQWAAAWSRRDVVAFFGFYHPDFYYRAKNLDLTGFIDYRRKLIEGADQIEVKLSSFAVSPGRDTARVTFRQDYRSDQMRDSGRKTLILKKTGSGWKILAETWNVN